LGEAPVEAGRGRDGACTHLSDQRVEHVAAVAEGVLVIMRSSIPGPPVAPGVVKPVSNRFEFDEPLKACWVQQLVPA